MNKGLAASPNVKGKMSDEIQKTAAAGVPHF
jgi:hypothetical protein